MDEAGEVKDVKSGEIGESGESRETVESGESTVSGVEDGKGELKESGVWIWCEVDKLISFIQRLRMIQRN